MNEHDSQGKDGPYVATGCDVAADQDAGGGVGEKGRIGGGTGKGGEGSEKALCRLWKGAPHEERGGGHLNKNPNLRLEKEGGLFQEKNKNPIL